MKLDEMLGYNPEDPDDRHAEILVEEHARMLRRLIQVRKDNGLEQADVAEAMGIDPSGVSRIESDDRDLRLSTLRRYAFACGAVIRHEVEPFAPHAPQASAGTPRPVVTYLGASMIPARWQSFPSAASAIVAGMRRERV